MALLAALICILAIEVFPASVQPWVMARNDERGTCLSDFLGTWTGGAALSLYRHYMRCLPPSSVLKAHAIESALFFLGV